MKPSFFTDTAGNEIAIPTRGQALSLLRNNLWVKRRYAPTHIFLAGSTVRGEATPESDLDILMVIPPVRGKRAITVSEQYHARFTHDHQKPHFQGRLVDFQFYYASSLPHIEAMDGVIRLT